MDFYEHLSEDSFPNYDYLILSKLIHKLLFNRIRLSELNPEEAALIIHNLKENVYYDTFLLHVKSLVNAIWISDVENTLYSNKPFSIKRALINEKLKVILNDYSSQIDFNKNINSAISLLTAISLVFKNNNPNYYDIIKNINMEKHTKKVLLVVATITELRNIIDLYNELTQQDSSSFSIDRHTYWNLGILNNSELFLFKVSMGAKGQGGSILGIMDGINAIDPDYVVQIGICFGLKPDKQKLTEILVSYSLQEYEHAKITDKEVIPRGDRIPANQTLIDRFESSAVTWNKTNVHFGLVLSGDKLVNSKAFAEELIVRFPDAIGGEMEGGGLLASCHSKNKGWILVKAISDWGYNKEDKYQSLALNNVIEFVYHTFMTTKL